MNKKRYLIFLKSKTSTSVYGSITKLKKYRCYVPSNFDNELKICFKSVKIYILNIF